MKKFFIIFKITFMAMDNEKKYLLPYQVLPFRTNTQGGIALPEILR